MTLERGTLIDNRFEIVAPLGQGGFGVVYEGRQLSTGQRVAVKVLAAPDPSALAAHPDAGNERRARFEREMALMSRLHHPNVARLMDYGALPDGTLFIALEFIDGEDLATVLSRGALPEAAARHVMLQVLDALAAAHAQGIVHRDLKPKNIMISASGTRQNAVVLDFGIAGLISPERDTEYLTLTERGHFVGTPAYMAPEQLEGRLSPQSDLYAWGLVMLECLTGQQALQGDSPAKLIAAQLSDAPVPLPVRLRDTALGRVIERATAKDPVHRFGSAADTAAALTAEAPTRPSWHLVAAVACGLVVGAGFALLLPNEPAPIAAAQPVSQPPQPSPETTLPARVMAWATAWEGTAQAADMPAFEGFYHPDFNGDGRDLKDHLAHRRALGTKARSINVWLKDLQLSAAPTCQKPGLCARWQVRFHQLYRADGYDDEGIKTQEWVLKDGQWLLVSEHWRAQ